MRTRGSGTKAAFPAAIAGLCGLLLAGCASLFGVHVEVARLVPAVSTEAATIRQIAVLPFEGPDGDRVADEVLALLAGIEVDARPYFEVIDRDRLPPSIAPVGVVPAAPSATRATPRPGVAPALGGYYTGRVEDIRIVSRVAHRQSRSCIERRDGKRDGPCTRWVVESIQCRIDTARFAFLPRLVEARTGKVVFSRSFAGAATSDSCEAHGSLSRADLLAAAKHAAYDEFRSHVAPRIRTIALRLIDADPRLTDPTTLAAFNRGIELAKARQMDRACEAWGGIRDSAGSSFAIAYNLGVCEELAGRHDAAAQHYARAQRLAGEPNEIVAAALERVRHLADDARRLESQVRQ